jgi:hypothetical protein
MIIFSDVYLKVEKQVIKKIDCGNKINVPGMILW